MSNLPIQTNSTTTVDPSELPIDRDKLQRFVNMIFPMLNTDQREFWKEIAGEIDKLIIIYEKQTETINDLTHQIIEDGDKYININGLIVTKTSKQSFINKDKWDYLSGLFSRANQIYKECHLI